MKVYDFLGCVFQPKTFIFYRGGSCNFQLSFSGGSVIFVRKGVGGPCVFYPPDFQMFRPPRPILFDRSHPESNPHVHMHFCAANENDDNRYNKNKFALISSHFIKTNRRRGT